MRRCHTGNTDKHTDFVQDISPVSTSCMDDEDDARSVRERAHEWGGGSP